VKEKKEVTLLTHCEELLD